MSYHAFGSRTSVEAGASPRLLLICLVGHGLLVVPIISASIPWVLALLLLIANALALRCHLLCWAFPAEAFDAKAFELDESGRLLLHPRQGEARPLTLLRVVWMWRSLVVMAVRERGALRSRLLVLSADAVAADKLRRLRVRLRWDRVDRKLWPEWRLVAAWPVGRNKNGVSGPVIRQ